MIKGIDVSQHQGLIDWDKVKSSDVEYVIIRAGYGKNNVDKCFKQNIEGAIKVGLKIGVYWFIYALNELDAIKNADKFHETVSSYKNSITMKAFADWEYDSDDYSIKNGVVQTKKSRTLIVRTFLERLKGYGYDVGNYANPDYIKSKFNDLSEYPLWLAYYSASEVDAMEYNPIMWQYTSKGTVPGISGNVDINTYYGSVESKVAYYPVPGFTLIDCLSKIGVNTTLAYRKKIAERNGIENYRGTVEQNLRMLELLNNGKLIML